MHDASVFSISAGSRAHGLKSAGFRHVAWGVTHKEADGEKHVLDADAPPDRAKELASRCRDMGLEPVMMFSEIYPENDKRSRLLTNRIKQASAGGVPQVPYIRAYRRGKASVWVRTLQAARADRKGSQRHPRR